MRIALFSFIIFSLTTPSNSSSNPIETHKDQTALAIITKNLKRLHYLAQQGHLWINEPDPSQSGPLDMCARAGNGKIMQFLIDRGALISRVDIHGKTPLMYAAESTNDECIKVSLKNGATAQRSDHKNKNALWYARRTQEKNDQVKSIILLEDAMRKQRRIST